MVQNLGEVLEIAKKNKKHHFFSPDIDSWWRRLTA
jgi:hypothetical protein